MAKYKVVVKKITVEKQILMIHAEDEKDAENAAFRSICYSTKKNQGFTHESNEATFEIIALD